MRRFFRILSVALLAVGHAHGVFGQEAPARVVSLAPSLTMNVYFLEQQQKLVGCTSYCDTAVADGKEVVASAIKVNVEKVVSLRPDLVITTALTDPETLAMLRRFNIRVEVFPTAQSFSELCGQTIRLGRVIGAESNAHRLVEQCEARVKGIAVDPKSGKSPSVFFQIGAKPLFTVIPGTFMNDYILLAGGRNIVTGTKTGTIAREAVIAANPDVIFIVSMGIVGDEEKSVWEGYPALSAAKGKKIFLINANDACTPTPVTFVRTLERVVQLTYSK